MATTQETRTGRSLAAVLVIAAAAAVYGVLAARTLLHGQNSVAETAALIRSWWYVGGIVRPYTATDSTWSMPLYFYQLGFWQAIAGLGPIPARALSIVLGAIDGLLLFLICRRLTANTAAAACATFIFLATPATIFHFATATPAATLAGLHLAAIWLIVTHLGRPRVWASVVLGLICAALYFYSQDMILAVIVLVPLYIAALGTKRWPHAVLVVAVIAVASAGLLAMFPAKLAHYAVRLPVLYPLLDHVHLLGANFILIDHGTVAANGMIFDFARVHFRDLLEAFVLPYSGTLLLAVALFVLAGQGLRVLWIAPLYFLWLAAAHYLGTAGFCSRCIADQAPAFAGIGALACGLSLAMIGRVARTHANPPAILMIAVAVAAVGLNAFAPALATTPAYILYPAPMMAETAPEPQRTDTIALARWLASFTPQPEPILAIHSLGRKKLPALPYAVFLSNHVMPAQSLDPVGTHRVINPRLSGRMREDIQAAVEDESLWTDETMRRWIERDYDEILFQDDPSIDLSALRAAITARFDLAATTSYQGATLMLFKRKAAQ